MTPNVVFRGELMISLAVLGAAMALSGSSMADDPPLRLPPGVRIPEGLADLQPASGEGWVMCQAAEIAAFSDRAHVRCLNGVDHGTRTQPPAFVAVDIVTQPGLAAALMTAGARARDSGNTLYVLIDYAPAANLPGCLADDCRRAAGFVVE